MHGWPTAGIPVFKPIKFMPPKVSAKKTTTRKALKVAAAIVEKVAVADQPPLIVEKPVVEPIIKKSTAAPVPVEPVPVESAIAPERTVDSVKAAAQADAQKDASNFPAPKTSAQLRPPSAPVEAPDDDTR